MGKKVKYHSCFFRLYGRKGYVSHMGKCKKSIIFPVTVMMISALVSGCAGETASPDSPIALDSWDGVSVSSVGESAGSATLLGGDISVAYDDERQTNVLSVAGGSYLEFPQDMFTDVTEGFTLAFSVKLDEACPDGANIIQLNPCGYGVGDKVWRDAPEISIKADLTTTFYIGGRTINGVFNASATYNNGISGVDDLSYAEPHGHKTRYAAAAGTGLEKGVWSQVVLSVSPEGYTLYVNGTAVAMTDTVNGSNIASSLDYLFGDDLLKTYVINSIGSSVYSDTPELAAQLDDIAVFKKALTADEAKNYNDLPADYKWDFSNASVKTDVEGYTSDLSKYLSETPISDVDLGTQLVSPDGKLQILLKTDAQGRCYIAGTRGETVLIEASRIGLVLEEADLSEGLTVDTANVTAAQINESFELLTGSSKTVVNRCNEYVIPFAKGGASFRLVVRVYDDGFAYKYDEVTVEGADGLTVTDESSEFVLTDRAVTWAFELNGTYEGEYVKRTNRELTAANVLLSTPMLAQVEEYYILFSEGAVFNNDGEYASSGLLTTAGSKQLVWTFGLARNPADEATSDLDSPGHIRIREVETVNGFSTPWRVAVISDDVDAFCTSDLIACLNDAPDPELYADTSYIEPGKVAWSWWAEDSQQGNYDKHIEYIDFAAANGWDSVCLDAGWRAFEERLSELCDYAAQKGIKIFVWINYRDMKELETMDALFSKWAAAGASGLKTDYFESDEAEVLLNMQWVAETAAKYKLMVLYHGCVRPAGEYRTYPNVLTMEAVQGEEWHKWFSYPTVENCLMYPFTRNICGSMDYTPICAPTSNGETHGFAIAKAVVYQSALQHFANAASVYERFSGLSLLNHIPTVWDDTLVYDGAPGKFISLMRSSGDEFYIGAMTLDARTVEYTLDFLGSGTYNAYIYGDTEDGTGLSVSSRTVKKGDRLTFDLLANGGVAVMITKDEIDLEIYEDPDTDNENYTYYEAESSNNTLSGTAVTATAVMCSGGKKVGYIGRGQNNTLTFNGITVEEAGEYEIVLFYCSGETRKVTVTVNGADAQEVTGLNSHSWDSYASVSFTVYLNAGQNTITFGNASYYAPDIDRIGVSKTAN